MADNPDLVRRDLEKLLQQLKNRADTQDRRIAALTTAATNQAAKQQRINQAIALTANVPLDVVVTWPTPWPDTGYGIYTQLTTGNAALGTVHATPKSGSKTVNDCIITVLSTTTIASAGLDVLGARV